MGCFSGAWLAAAGEKLESAKQDAVEQYNRATEILEVIGRYIQ